MAEIEEENTPAYKDFVRGYNDGYLLARSKPAILASILKETQITNSYLLGLKSGKDQLELERAQEKQKQPDTTRQPEQGRRR